MFTKRVHRDDEDRAETAPGSFLALTLTARLFPLEAEQSVTAEATRIGACGRIFIPDRSPINADLISHP